MVSRGKSRRCAIRRLKNRRFDTRGSWTFPVSCSLFRMSGLLVGEGMSWARISVFASSLGFGETGRSRISMKESVASTSIAAASSFNEESDFPVSYQKTGGLNELCMYMYVYIIDISGYLAFSGTKDLNLSSPPSTEPPTPRYQPQYRYLNTLSQLVSYPNRSGALTYQNLLFCRFLVQILLWNL